MGQISTFVSPPKNVGRLLPVFIQWRYSAVDVKITSPEEFSAVSIESCITRMIKPVPTAGIDTSAGIPNRDQARGISSSSVLYLISIVSSAGRPARFSRS